MSNEINEPSTTGITKGKPAIITARQSGKTEVITNKIEQFFDGCHAIEQLLEAAASDHNKDGLLFDFSDVRPKGSPINAMKNQPTQDSLPTGQFTQSAMKFEDLPSQRQPTREQFMQSILTIIDDLSPKQPIDYRSLLIKYTIHVAAANGVDNATDVKASPCNLPGYEYTSNDIFVLESEVFNVLTNYFKHG